MTHKFVNDPDIKFLLRIQKKLHNSKRRHWVLELLYSVYIQLVYGGFIPVAAELGDNIVFPHVLFLLFQQVYSQAMFTI